MLSHLSYIPSTENLDIEYAAEDGPAAKPAILLTLTMVPLRCARIKGSAAFVTRTTP
jgi:hypothetical protein